MYRVLPLILLLTVSLGCIHTTPESPTPPPPSQAPEPPVVTTKPLYDVISEELTFDAAGTTVHGTLTRPVAGGPFPGLLMIQGSGPTDRDWNSTLLAGKNGSGKLLAEALARRGVVVLRYDKRGTGKTELPGNLSWDDYLAEQRAGLALLAANDLVNPDLIYPAGHSEGGIHALRLSADPGTPLAGLILLSTPGRSIMDTVLGQVRDQIRLGDVDPEKEEQMVNGMRTVLEQFAAGEEMDLSLLGGDMGLMSIAMSFRQPAAESFIRELLVFDPTKALAECGLPVLILNGDRDMQVKPHRDTDRLADAALGAGLPMVRRNIPEADHVLKVEKTPVEELGPHLAVNYNDPNRELHPLVVDTISEWLQKRQARP